MLMKICLFIIADIKNKDFLQLPTLELENNLRLFSTDGIAKYLFPDEGELRDEVCSAISFQEMIKLFK